LVLLLAFFALSSAKTVSNRSTVPRQKILEYWTPERIASAIPRDIVLQGDGKTNPTGRVNYKVSSSEVPPSGTTRVDASKYNTNPYKQVGKIFFSIGTSNYVCSGSAVGGNVVLTAGHCVAGGGEWFQNFMFIPQYDSGSQPFGAYTGHDFFCGLSWWELEDFSQDYAFAVVEGDMKLEDAVGKLNVLSDHTSVTDNWDATGYPQGSPYNGRYMYQSYGPQIRVDKNFNPNTRGIDTTMTGGCSGGPWIYNIEISGQNTDKANLAGGINSYVYTLNPKILYSPYFDTTFKNLYNDALQSGS